MDFDSVKAAATVNYTSQAPNKNQRQESPKNDTNNTAVEADRDASKIKDIYNALLSDIKENTSENDEEQKTSYTDKEIDRMIKIANDKLAPIKRSFEYSIHDVTKRMSIKILDGETKELIKEIPPEKMQNAIAKMWELAGLLVDEKR